SLDGDDSGDDAPDFTSVFVRQAGAVAIVDDVTISDTDDVTLEGATITLTNPQGSDTETLRIDALDTEIEGADDGQTITLTGTASLSDYARVIGTLMYDNSTLLPNATTRQVTITVTDGQATSTVATAFVEVIRNIALPPEFDDDGYTCRNWQSGAHSWVNL